MQFFGRSRDGHDPSADPAEDTFLAIAPRQRGGGVAARGEGAAAGTNAARRCAHRLTRPGGNSTGFTNFEYGISTKWQELLKQIAPGLTREPMPTNARTELPSEDAK